MPDNEELVERVALALLPLRYASQFDATALARAAIEATRIEQLHNRVERLTEAVTPSGDTKAAYHGEFSFNIEEWDDDAACERIRKVYVPWDTVKQIMAAIKARAALTGDQNG